MSLWLDLGVSVSVTHTRRLLTGVENRVVAGMHESERQPDHHIVVRGGASSSECCVVEPLWQR